MSSMSSMSLVSFGVANFKFLSKFKVESSMFIVQILRSPLI